ncbi:MAG: hypothetical protein HOE02_05705 [Candidatus Marinimicrobia bacterium]|jgi:hypothetical protein|nr:hypothetical protein [Candidatus Neomarinimicrobiota bacterium]
MKVITAIIQFIKDLKPWVKMTAMICICIVLVTFIICAALTGNFELLLDTIDRWFK